MLTSLNHVHLHAVQNRRKDCRAPERTTLDCHSVVRQQVIEVVDGGVLTQPEAVHVDVVTIDTVLFKDKVWYATETKSFELVLVTVRLKNFSNFLDGKLVVIGPLIKGPQLVQVAIRCRKVNGNCHVDIPASLEIVHETVLLFYLKRGELDRTRQLRLSFLVNQFPFLVFFLILDLLRRYLTSPVEQVTAVRLS